MPDAAATGQRFTGAERRSAPAGAARRGRPARQPKMADMDEESLAGIANRLYAAPLDGFIAARTAAAKEASGQDKELGAAVRGLAKPSVGAWAVNMLAVHDPDVLDELAGLGLRMRTAQASLDAKALRDLARERRTMLASAVEAARTVVERQGRALSDTIAGDVEETLRALTADEGAAAAVRSGRLLKTLSADGVSAADLDGAVAVPSALPADASPAPPPDVDKAAPARTARTTAERASGPRATKPRLEAVRQTPRTASRPAVEKAKAALAAAEAEEADSARRSQEVQELAQQAAGTIASLREEIEGLRARLKAAETGLDQAKKQLAGTSAEAKQAQREADKAARAALLARERVLRLENP
ncbi:hypothetical protein GA0061083_3165 [Pseudarthrobacter enclensis]|nr:hypothetical protein GA0061083_3165 [Pseudarthrobacter enclensis]